MFFPALKSENPIVLNSTAHSATPTLVPFYWWIAQVILAECSENCHYLTLYAAA